MVKIDTNMILVVIITAILSAIVANKCSKPDYVAPEIVNAMIDENTRVMTAEVKSLEHIVEQLEMTSQAMAERIERKQEQIIAYTNIEGQLRIYADSLEYYRNRPTRSLKDFYVIGIDGLPVVKDTTITKTRTFSNGLFAVSCLVTVSRLGTYSIVPELSQLRPVNVQHTLTMQRSGHFNSYVHLPDFDMQDTQIESFQLPVRRNQTWWDKNGNTVIWASAGTVIAVQTLRILFGG